jgi:hypothetical protein
MKLRIIDPNLKLVDLQGKPQLSLIKKLKPELSHIIVR